MTDLVERYLAAVERRLPKETASDIVAELRELLTTRIEAREAELGRGATHDVIAAALKEFGHPAIVAARYNGAEYLIGPKLYPWFWDAQRTGVGLVIAIAVIVLAVRAVGADDPVSFVTRGFGNVLEGAVFAFGLITAVFVILERTGTDLKIAMKWSPKALPQDNVRRPKTLFETIFALGADIVFLLWWTGVIAFPNHLPGSENSITLQFSEAWQAVHTPVLALALIAAAVHLADLVHPAWSRLRALTTIAAHCGGLAILWVLFRAGPLVLVEGVVVEGERATRIVQTVNLTSAAALGVAALIWSIAIGAEVWRLWQSMRLRAAQPA